MARHGTPVAESKGGDINVPDVPLSTMRFFVSFLYTASLSGCLDQVDSERDPEAATRVVVEVMRLAHRYSVHIPGASGPGGLECFFVALIKERRLLVVETVLEYFQVSRLLEMQSLKEMCLQFMAPVLEAVAKHESCKRISMEDPSFSGDLVIGTRRCLMSNLNIRAPMYVDVAVVVSFMRNGEAVFESMEIDLLARGSLLVRDLAVQLVDRLLMFQKYRREMVCSKNVTFFSSKFPPTMLDEKLPLDACHGWNGKKFTVLAKVGL